MEYELDYKGNIKFSKFLMAGAISGVMEHSVMFPVDVIKTRMQSITHGKNYRQIGVVKSLSNLLKSNGIGGLMKGYPALVCGALPAHACYFTGYEYSKNKLNYLIKNENVITGISASIATLCHDIFMTPAEAIKQRMQMHGNKFMNCLQCTKTCFNREGSRAFYRSFSTQLLTNLPFQISHFIIYENMQNVTNPNRKYNLLSHLASGAAAGGIAAAITTPLDVCKTVLNTQDCPFYLKKATYINSPIEAIRVIYKSNGYSGFFHGLKARALLQAPGTAISWVVYELFKSTLLNN
ncbi:Mitochondrial S-adenosylmethionine transporter [Intoshia linei]|uniref:Mitoferrin-1 n=1 Tax=Intoshia linei TaxID=1819745 RepID=A0A177BC83_9BILA|nr:Mitochondrial S-adenosylmethionine transporter [Intoshia linei]